MSNQKQKKFASVRKENIPKATRPCATITLNIPKCGTSVTKKTLLDDARVTAEVKCCAKNQSPRGSLRPIERNKNEDVQDRSTPPSGTWHQMLRKDAANLNSGNPKKSNENEIKEKLPNKDYGKLFVVLKQLFKILLDSIEGEKINEGTLQTLKETEMMVYAMASECNYDSSALQNDNYKSFANDFWNIVFAELTRKKMSSLQRKLSVVQDEKELAQKNVKILKKQLESGKQVIIKSLEEKAKNDALVAEIKKSALNNMQQHNSMKQDVNNLKRTKVKLEEELALKQKEFNSVFDLVNEMKTEMKSLKKENRSLKMEEGYLSECLTTYHDAFHSLTKSLEDKVQDLRSKTCLSSPTCSTFVESPNISPFPRGSTSTIRDPNYSNSLEALSCTESDPQPANICSFNSPSSLLLSLQDKKHSTSIQESSLGRRFRFSRVKNDCQEFFGSVIPQAVALVDGANNLRVLSDNMVTTMTHVTESSSLADTNTYQSDL